MKSHKKSFKLKIIVKVKNLGWLLSLIVKICSNFVHSDLLGNFTLQKWRYKLSNFTHRLRSFTPCTHGLFVCWTDDLRVFNRFSLQFSVFKKKQSKLFCLCQYNYHCHYHYQQYLLFHICIISIIQTPTWN